MTKEIIINFVKKNKKQLSYVNINYSDFEIYLTMPDEEIEQRLKILKLELDDLILIENMKNA